MSIDALSWAFNLDLPNSGVKLTLLALANYADADDCTAYPSQKAMSQKTCLSTRAIRDHLVTLEALGVISRVPRKREDGTYTTDLFTLNVGFVPSNSSGKNNHRQISPTAKNNNNQRQISPNPAADSAYQESSLTSSITKTKPSDKPVREQKESFALPDWIQKEAWEGFIAMRKAIRKQLTPHAMQLAIRELQKLRSDGEDVNAVLNQSTMNSWQGLFPIKDSQRGNVPRTQKFDPIAYVNRFAKKPSEYDEKIIEH